MVTEVTEDVYRGHDNDFVNNITLDGEVVDFSTVTRMTLTAGGQTFDSDDVPSPISWESDGVITFNITNVSMNAGINSATLIAFDPLHLNGQVICHPGGNARLNLNVL